MPEIAQPQGVVFIASDVPDLQDLLNGLQPGEQAFIIDPSSDGLQQIADILTANNLSGLTSISIVAHGASGELDLGSSPLIDPDLATNSNALAEIGAALAPGGAIQLYGCDVAQGAAGQQFINDFSALAGGVTVEASTQVVGSTALGGSWTLDAVANGTAAPSGSSPPFTSDALDQFQGVLEGEPPPFQAHPALSTTPSSTAVTLGSGQVTLFDQADLTGGAIPAGSITFTLVGPGGIVVDTETVAVNGNGTYTTPTGFTLPGSGAATGTYQWDASYGGDTDNASASDNNDPAEQVTVSAADPTLSTAPGSTAITLGPNPVRLTDSADLQNGYNPTGSITFTLAGPSGIVVDTETVAVNGNGTYTTPTGFTLPSNGGVAGTYQWDASYSGDASNNTASDNNNSAEQVTVSAAVLTLSTTPTILNPVTTGDTADLENGDNPTGTIIFTLFGPGGTTPLDTEAVTVHGNGRYSTPTGYTLPDNAALGTYQWDATYSGDANNNSAADIDNPAEQVTVVACYCAGTLILTDRGEVPVETLAIGDSVMTASGARRPVKWIGRRSYAGRFVMGRTDILPICIKAGSLDDNVPKRDLWISPHHAMYFADDGGLLGGLLIEAIDLVNGLSVVQAERVDKIEYFHIELETHDVIIAEGAESETFLDDDSRGIFHNVHEYSALYPGEAVAVAARYCAPRLQDGYELEAVRRRIAGRAQAGSRPYRVKVHRRTARH